MTVYSRTLLPRNSAEVAAEDRIHATVARICKANNVVVNMDETSKTVGKLFFKTNLHKAPHANDPLVIQLRHALKANMRQEGYETVWVEVPRPVQFSYLTQCIMNGLIGVALGLSHVIYFYL